VPEDADIQTRPEPAELLIRSAGRPSTGTAGAAPSIAIFDDLLDDTDRERVFAFLQSGGWRFGWKSRRKTDTYSFWHKHFAGQRKAEDEPYDCTEELRQRAPLLHQLWLAIERTLLRGHTLHRCYANGLPYGCDGTLHTDSDAASDYTSIYYADPEWHPNWGGETVFFNREKNDIVSSVYPKSNRLVIFPGAMPHVARGVSRTCPKLRVTLMYKTRRAIG
jgi:SM-20-related protein